jgi:hypothetical protein
MRKGASTMRAVLVSRESSRTLTGDRRSEMAVGPSFVGTRPYSRLRGLP